MKYRDKLANKVSILLENPHEYDRVPRKLKKYMKKGIWNLYEAYKYRRNLSPMDYRTIFRNNPLTQKIIDLEYYNYKLNKQIDRMSKKLEKDIRTKEEQERFKKELEANIKTLLDHILKETQGENDDR